MDELDWDRFVVGCGTFGGIGGAAHLIGRGLDDRASHATLDEAASLGLRMLDTAERYAGGISEITIGRWLTEHPGTDTASITTKVAPPDPDASDAAFDASFIRPTFAGSLDRLGVARVDVLLLHAPHDPTPIEATLEALASILEDGTAGHVGACNVDRHQLVAALDAADRLGLPGFEIVQNGYSLLVPDDERDVRAVCRERSLAFTPFSPLAGGVLTGKYRRDEPPPDDTRLALRPEGVDELLDDRVFDAIDQLKDAARAHGVSCGALALAWLAHHPDVTAPVVGPSRTSPHLGHVAEALEVHLDADEHERIADWFRAARR